jgi:glycerate dehydrogenase
MKIVVLDGFTLNPGDLSWSGLQALGNVKVYDRTPENLIAERSKEAEILITNKTPISRELLNACVKIKYIGVLATGYNNVPGYGTASVAQAVFALILALSNRVKEHSDAVLNGDWSLSKDFCFWNYPLVELAGKTLGIIGFGNIGRQVATIGEAFGMKIVAYSRTQTEQTALKNFRWVGLNDIFKESDVLSLHCPLFAETKGIINKETLGLMKESSLLINTSRGPLIVEEDLAEALNNEVIAGAGLDVLSLEPPSASNPLLSAKNCIITPHIAWASKEARERLMGIAVDNVKSFIQGKGKNIVNI